MHQAYGAAGTPINKTQMLLDLQNRVGVLEEKADCVRTIRFYTPNETMNNQTDWKDAAVFTWTPENATDNAILHGNCYFQFHSLPLNGPTHFRITVNEDQMYVDTAVDYTATGYKQSRVYELSQLSQGWYITEPNQNSYTIKFQCQYLGPSYVKDINILLEVMDGLPPS
jgi:hypothetical protein